MRIRISKKGLVAAGVAGAILVCGAVFRMVDHKSVKHVNTAAVGDDFTPIADAVEDALNGNNANDVRTGAAAVAGASTIEEKKEEVKAEKTEEKKEETPAATQAAVPAKTVSSGQTKNTANKVSNNTSNSKTNSAKKEEVINEEVPVEKKAEPVKEAPVKKTQKVEEYVGSDADVEKAIKAQKKEAQAKTVEKTGGGQFVEGVEE